MKKSLMNKFAWHQQYANDSTLYFNGVARSLFQAPLKRFIK
jgi:hypothetical protein